MKKIVSLFLALMLLLSLCPVTAFAVDDAADDSDWSNGETLSEGTYDLGGATITINGPLVITGTVTVKNGTIKRGTDYNDGVEMLFVSDGKSLNLESVTVDGGAVWSGAMDDVLERGTENTGAKNSSELIYVGKESTAVLTNCTLQNNECSDSGGGGAISVDSKGSLTATNTTMCNNAKTAGQAGAIKAYTGATVNLTRCELYGNEADKHGGAIQIWGGYSSDTIVHMTMTDCTVRNNKAGGVGGGIAVSDYSQFIMNGGTIKDNATTDDDKRGGGVGFRDKNTAMSISGNAVISGNVAGINANNLYIGNNNCNKLSVETMGSKANVGVTMSSPGVFSSGGASYAVHFKSDNAAYEVAADSSVNLKLVATGTDTYTVTYKNADDSSTLGSVTVATGEYTLPACTFTPPSGKQFAGWAYAADGEVISDAVITVSADTTLYAIWEDAPHAHDMSVSCGGSGVTFEAWDGTGTPTGNVYLTEDVTLAETLTISGEVNLCLNGYSIEKTAGSVIQVSSGATLNICDCGSGGSVTNSGSTNSGDTTYGIYNSGTVNVYGGTISGGTGISNYGTLTVSGGTVSGNTYGISTQGTFKLSGAPAITGGSNSADVIIDDYQKVITIDGTLTYTSPIVVEMKLTGIFTSGWSSHMSGVADTVVGNYFTSANDGCIVVKSSSTGELRLSRIYNVSYNSNGATSGTAPVDDNSPYALGKAVTVLGNTGYLAKEGYEFSGWNTKADGTGTAYSPDDTFFIANNTTLYAVWKLHVHNYTYTVTFDANGGSGTMDAMTNEASVEFTYPACTFTAPAGKQFKGWSTDAGSTEVIAVGTKTYFDQGDTLALYAIWETIEDSTQQPADKYTISGKVVEKATPAPVAGAKVELKLGDKEIATTTTEEDGSYSFADQPTGTYNVVASKDGKIVTVLVELRDNKMCNIELPADITNSIVEHVTPEGFTAGTLVGGLDKVAQNLREQLSNATATDIEVKLTVEEQKTSDIGEDVQKAIKKEASGKELLFFDLSVWKKIGTETQYMGEVSSLLEIYIPFNGSDKENVMVYRYHGNAAEVLPSVNKDSVGEGYWVGDDGYIHILTKHFSTYAIGYTEKSDSQPSYNYPIYVAPVEDEAEQIASPQTFDAGITLPVVVTILGATGSAWLLRKKDD